MKLMIESPNGHDEVTIPDKPEEVQKAVEAQLKDNKWVTLQNKDGTSELLTPKDAPSEDSEEEPDGTDEDGSADTADPEELDEEDKKLMQEAGNWKDAFKPQPAKPKALKPGEKFVPPASTKPVPKREEWESKFAKVESAVSSHQAKGG